MKITTTLIAIALTITSFAQTLKVNTKKAEVSYNFVAEKVTGNVSGFDATITFNADDLTKSTFEGSVDATTLTSGNGMRDKHLQAKDYFNTEKFPKMSFKSNVITKTEKGYSMKGKMTIKDVTQEVEILFVYTAGVFEGKCIIYTNDFNVASKKVKEESKVLIKFSIPVE